jgi:predicted nucleic acid-binding protein
METTRDLRDVIDIRLPDERLVLDAARLKADHPIAYADAFGAALAMSEAATLWTGDPELLVDGSPWSWRDLCPPT